MLQSIRHLYGKHLGASDGPIGHVQDFYFDDQNWAIRYLVADTGSWLPGRQVLISPYSLEPLEPDGKLVGVRLTRKQIEDSPSIETHKPLSRQYEEEYYRYYGWPFYWNGNALWGMSGVPILELPDTPPDRERTPADEQRPESPDAHLRSAQALNGYHIQASDGLSGHVSDFMMDPQNWGIRQLVAKTGHLFAGKEVWIPVNKVKRISYVDSTVFVDLTAEAIEQGLPPQLETGGNVP